MPIKLVTIFKGPLKVLWFAISLLQVYHQFSYHVSLIISK